MHGMVGRGALAMCVVAIAYCAGSWGGDQPDAPVVAAAPAAVATAESDSFVSIQVATIAMRASPSSSAPIIGTAAQGEVFVFGESSNGYYGFDACEGAYAYVPKATARIVKHANVPAPSNAALRGAADAIDKAETRALHESMERFPDKDGDFQRQIAYKQLLDSRYCIAVLRKFGVPLLYWPDVQGFGLTAL